jgi:oxygen-dependent protoporphyrinogen oxidase
MTHVTIIGGGIAGLATAYYLQKKSREQSQEAPIHYTLVDSEPCFGGKIVTANEGDFVIEGGPDSFITQKPWGRQLCLDLGLAARLIPTNDDRRNIYVLDKGKLVPFPGGYRLTVPTEFIPFALSPLISPLGKLRMGLDLVIPPRQDKSDESLGSFIRRRLGQEALDKIGAPIMAGIYVADPERLSIQSTFPMFVEMEREYGSLIKAMRAARQHHAGGHRRNGKPPAMFNSLHGGMKELAETLVDALEGDLRPNCRVMGLRYRSPGFEITFDSAGSLPLTTDAVVLAVPAYVAASLLSPIEPKLTGLLNQIRYVSTATISLGYRRVDLGAEQNLDGFGFIIPKSENRQILACTWSSTKFDHRSPVDRVLLRVFVGGDGAEHLVELPDDDLIALARAEVAETMGITTTPVVQKLFRWIKGNPQYDVGHLERVEQIETLATAIPGLYLTGSAFRGIGIPDCVKSALNTVEQILDRAN